MSKSTKTTIRGGEVRNLIVERHDFHAGGKAYGDTWNFRGVNADLFIPFMNMGYLPAPYAEATFAIEARRRPDFHRVFLRHSHCVARQPQWLDCARAQVLDFDNRTPKHRAPRAPRCSVQFLKEVHACSHF